MKFVLRLFALAFACASLVGGQATFAQEKSAPVRFAPERSTEWRAAP